MSNRQTLAGANQPVYVDSVDGEIILTVKSTIESPLESGSIKTTLFDADGNEIILLKTEDFLLRDILKEVLDELKINNLYMSKIVDELFTKEDLE